MASEHQKELDLLSSILEAAMDSLAATLAGNHEIVLHNLTTPAHSVQKIINGHISGRKPGDNLLSGPDTDAGFAGLVPQKPNTPPVTIKDYKTTTESGKLLSSASTLFYSSKGEPLMAFCVNVDTSPYEQLRKAIDVISSKTEPQSQEPELSQLIEQTIQDIIDRHSVSGKKIPKSQRVKIVSEMHGKGIFKMKGGIQQAAQTLGVTRHTIYNDLERLNEK
ncbi:histidine kinase [Buttiauxella warmboldiae]|uniref:Histidine kinase n=1 Tax=Buttiauxella warmboldiae TaxID=82993 RepID=A0A3N5EG14_9ENTR|nr:PAS domain-containing protein [Buttiauxella warmboldiae]RPH30222.1 histidine kinase [Buttiauxella warmboldiae]